MKTINLFLAPLLWLSASAHAQSREFPLYSEAVPVCAIGTIVNMGDLDPLILPPLSIERSDSGGRFVYSGSPEYATAPGIAYQDTFNAGDTVRLYVYHANRARIPLRISVVLEPVSGSPVVEKLNTVLTSPSKDYFGVGRLSSFIQLCRPIPPIPLRLPVDGPTLLDTDLDKMVAQPGRPEVLVHTIHDFRVTGGSVRMSVVAVEESADTLKRFPELQFLSRDTNHDRGTYEGLTREITVTEPYKTTAGPMHIRLQDGKADPFMPGRDAVMDRPGAYRGAYGVIFKIHFRLESPDGRRVALLLNPRAGALAGAVAEESLWKTETGGLKAVRAANHAPSIGQGLVKEKTEAVVLGKWNPAQTTEVTIFWTPPATSSTPVEMILIPYAAQ